VKGEEKRLLRWLWGWTSLLLRGQWIR